MATAKGRKAKQAKAPGIQKAPKADKPDATAEAAKPSDIPKVFKAINTVGDNGNNVAAKPSIGSAVDAAATKNTGASTKANGDAGGDAKQVKKDVAAHAKDEGKNVDGGKGSAMQPSDAAHDDLPPSPVSPKPLGRGTRRLALTTTTTTNAATTTTTTTRGSRGFELTSDVDNQDGQGFSDSIDPLTADEDDLEYDDDKLDKDDNGKGLVYSRGDGDDRDHNNDDGDDENDDDDNAPREPQPKPQKGRKGKAKKPAKKEPKPKRHIVGCMKTAGRSVARPQAVPELPPRRSERIAEKRKLGEGYENPIGKDKKVAKLDSDADDDKINKAGVKDGKKVLKRGTKEEVDDADSGKGKGKGTKAAVTMKKGAAKEDKENEKAKVKAADDKEGKKEKKNKENPGAKNTQPNKKQKRGLA